MADQFWIQVRPDGVIIASQRTNGKQPPLHPTNRMIQVREEMYQRIFRNPTDPKGDYVDGVEYKLNEVDVPARDKGKDDVVVDERKLDTRVIVDPEATREAR